MMNVVIRKRKRDLVGLIILTIYIYMVHNRAVGIGLAVAFFLLVLAVKELKVAKTDSG